MNTHWHEQIQRCMTGDATPEEIIALQQALKDDAQLRALYLDYLNLDAGLMAAAESMTIAGSETGRTAAATRPAARQPSHHWRWIAAAAACAALVALALLPAHRDASSASTDSSPRASSRVQPDFTATFASTQGAIAQLSIKPASPLPAWMSPTAALLDQPGLSQ